jgi:hypothetical protein
VTAFLAHCRRASRVGGRSRFFDEPATGTNVMRELLELAFKDRRLFGSGDPPTTSGTFQIAPA